MNTFLAFLGGLGGLAVFITAVWAVIRAIMRQVSATEANTNATNGNTAAIRELEHKVDTLDRTVSIHGEQINNQGAELSRLRDAINGGPGR